MILHSVMNKFYTKKNMKSNSRDNDVIDFFISGKNESILKDSDDIENYGRDNARKAVATYKSSSSFGCCSKYKECSVEGECLHENRLYATGCGYRSNMEAGNNYMLDAK